MIMNCHLTWSWNDFEQMCSILKRSTDLIRIDIQLQFKASIDSHFWILSDRGIDSEMIEDILSTTWSGD